MAVASMLTSLNKSEKSNEFENNSNHKATDQKFQKCVLIEFFCVVSDLKAQEI